MAHEETDILNRWRLKWSKWGVLFRQQVGMFWAGVPEREWEENGVKYVTLKSAYKMKMGVTGLHDYLGWHTMIVTPDMVGKKVAIAASVEGKTEDGKLTDEQINFMRQLRLAGGISFVVRSEDTIPSGWGL